MPRSLWRRLVMPVQAMYRAVVYTVAIIFYVGAMIFFAGYVSSELENSYWTAQMGLFDVITGMLGGVGWIEGAYLDMGFSLPVARKSAFATVPLSLFLIFFVASLYDLREESE